MTKDHRSVTHAILARIDRVSEKTIFWSLISTVVAVALLMLKGVATLA
jgi:hypothetical protein